MMLIIPSEGKWLANSLYNSEVYKNSKTVAVYVSLPGELPTLSIIERVLSGILNLRYHVAEKKCFLPKITSEGDMKMLQIYSREDFDSLPLVNYAKFSLREPTVEFNNKPRNAGSPTDIPLDLVIVPGILATKAIKLRGLAFDKKGGRLGRGKGYYDGFIRKSVEESDSLKVSRPHFSKYKELLAQF